jgi:tetratricopeptide (TPR) repeat protein
MAGELDVYQSCPCGSGKKLKFCCHEIFGDMMKIAEMQQHHQYQMALAALESLEKKPSKEAWSRAWVKTSKALVQSALHKPEEARRLVLDVLEELPGHPLATVINGLLALSAEGYPAAKRAIYEAFEIRARTGQNAYLTSHLAYTLAVMLGAKGHVLAAREHFALAVSFDPENEEAGEAYLELVGDTSIPYPVRSHFALAPFVGEENLRETYVRAAELASFGCFSDAAKTFGQIARQIPNQSWVWWNIALCHAWAAEDPLAVEAFKAAAANESDPEAAAICLLLSRLLHPPSDANRAERLTQEYRVQSVGKLLTLLDQQPRLVRGPLSPEDLDDEAHPAAWYHLLDRDPSAVRPDDLTAETVPHILGQVIVFDSDTKAEHPAKAIVATLGRDALSQLTQQFAEVAGTEVELLGEPTVVGYSRAETLPLMLPWRIPDELSPARTELLQKARWDKILNDIWPQTPQESLGGRSPTDAANLPEMQNALRASVLALDVFCEQSGGTLDQAAIRSRLRLPPAAPLELGPDDNPNLLSILHLSRLAFDRLTDEQLVSISNRITRLGHSRLSYQVIQVLLGRPALVAKVDVTRLYLMQANLCRRQFRSDEALEWLQKGKQEAKARKQPLESLVLLEMEELILRSVSPDDPKLSEIAATLWNYYRPKLPKAAEMIVNLLNQLEIPGPWNAGGPEMIESGALAAAGTAAGGIWTPEAEASGPTSKLWLPGQE